MHRRNYLILGILLCSSVVLSPLQSWMIARKTDGATIQNGKSAADAVSPLVFQRVLLRYRSDAPVRLRTQKSTNAVVFRTKKNTTNPHLAQLTPGYDQQDASQLLSIVDHDDIQPRHRILANQVLRLFPASCRANLKDFYVRYDQMESRALAGKSKLIISGLVPDEEFVALMIHELGHVFDLGDDPACLGGTIAAGTSEFADGKDPVYQDDPSLDFYRISWLGSSRQKAGIRPQDFVSGYAAWDAFEDFAETHAYFVLQNDAFRMRAQQNPALAQKYNWFLEHLYPNGVQIATGLHEWNGEVPWDVTKLAYIWHPGVEVAKK